MKIQLQAIPEKGLVLRGEKEPSFINVEDAGFSFFHPVLYELEIRRADKLIIVRGKFSTRVEFICSRCLKKINSEIRISDFRTQIKVEDPAGVIDLTEEVREYIILAVPYKPLCCRKCLGICSTCGQNLNEGPCDCSVSEEESPWAKLSEIFSER